MKTEMGEYIVGACLKLIKECAVVDYNVRRPGGRLAGLDELDVMGLDFKNKKAYLCEVTTHLDGLQYGKNRITTAEKIRTKYIKMQEYADNYLSKYFAKRHFMFWSPVVGPSAEDELIKIKGLELVINENYTAYIGLLQEFVKNNIYDTGNPAVRILQIIGHVKKIKE